MLPLNPQQPQQHINNSLSPFPVSCATYFYTHGSYPKDVNGNVCKRYKNFNQPTIQYQPQSQSAALKDM